MTLTSKFKKDIGTLRAAANKEIYLDIKNPKLYKKVKRYYEGLQYIDLNGEDPDADYNAVIECIIEDLNLWLKYYYKMNHTDTFERRNS